MKYKGIEVTEENEDELWNACCDELHKEFDLQCCILDKHINAYNVSYYLFKTMAELVEDIVSTATNASIWETKSHLELMKNLLIHLERNIGHISIDDMIKRVDKMQEISNTPLPKIEEEETK